MGRKNERREPRNARRIWFLSKRIRGSAPSATKKLTLHCDSAVFVKTRFRRLRTKHLLNVSFRFVFYHNLDPATIPLALRTENTNERREWNGQARFSRPRRNIQHNTTHSVVLTVGEVRVLTASLRCFKFNVCCWSVCVPFARGGAREPNGQNISPRILSIESATQC